MLTYLSGIGASRQQKKTERIQERAKRQEIKQTARQQKLTSGAKFATAAAKSGSQLVSTRIQKAKVQKAQRKAFKKAGEPLAVSPSDIFAPPAIETEGNLEFEQGEQSIDQPEFTDTPSIESMDDMGIIYPGAAFGAAKKQKTKNPAKQAAAKETIKKISKVAIDVAKAQLEAKGIKFPSKEQVTTQAAKIEEPKESFFSKNKNVILIGSAALLGGILLLKKKK